MIFVIIEVARSILINLKEKGPVSEAKQTVVDIWDSQAIGQVENPDIEDEEQLFANELVVIEKENDSDNAE